MIDAFRLINPQLMMLGQEPRQTTSNVGHLNKPSVQVSTQELHPFTHRYLCTTSRVDVTDCSCRIDTVLYYTLIGSFLPAVGAVIIIIFFASNAIYFDFSNPSCFHFCIVVCDVRVYFVRR